MDATAYKEDSTGSVTATAKAGTLVWISDTPIPSNIYQAISERHNIRHISPDEPLAKHADDAQVALIHFNEPAANLRQISMVVEQLHQSSMIGLLLLPERDWGLQRLLRPNGRLVVAVSEGSPQAIAAAVSVAAQLQPTMENLSKEITRIRSLGSGIGKTLDQIDQDMRLAARLQQDFLPKSLPELGPLRFSVMFRPATWVSGDIYDVQQLDEIHVGFYVVDAVGHGMAAALMTMFVKQALPTKRIMGHKYEIVPPDVAMTELNQALCEQGLSSCQFCSALYCVVNSQTLEMSYARAGHPEPILLGADGQTSTLGGEGALLGVIPDGSYGLSRTRLSPGDRIVLHSDGAEDAFRGNGLDSRRDFIAAMESMRHLPVDEMMLQMASLVDSLQGSLHPADDITVVVMDVGVPAEGGN
ncbi:MAG: serine/threonine-protein phosphatase [Planctomycetes bacterium]|nr:serine/threonine-protein phosphatase [Planctomycetota bacterium]